jgi:hypothetical protein
MKLKNLVAVALVPSAIALFAAVTPASAAGTVSARPALGGGSISADTAASAPGSAFTNVGSLGLDEALPHTIGTGTVALAAPAGFAFGTAPVTVSVSPTSSTMTVSADNCLTSAGQATVTPGSTLAFSICSQSTTTPAHITVVGTSVQPAEGTPLAVGEITLDPSSTALLPGIDASSSFGHLQETVGALDHITVSPSAASIPVTATQAYSASPADQFGNPRTDAIAWSANSAAGTISNKGVLTAGTTAGAYTGAVVASAGAVASAADVTLIPGAVSTVAITPSTATVVAGQPVAFTAHAYDKFGNATTDPVSLTADPSVGSLDSSGVLTATTAAGKYAKSVTATLGGKSATADVAVTPDSLASVVLTAPGRVAVGTTTQLSATATDKFGNATGDAISYTVNDPAAGTVSSAGVFTAGTTPGTYLRAITATAGSLTDSADVDVANVRVPALVTVSGPKTAHAGQPTAYTATVKDQFGSVIPNPSLTWSTSVPGSIDANGVLTATGTGSFAKGVTATAGNASGSLPVNVQSALPSTLTLATTAATVAPAGSATISATVLDQYGNPVPGYWVSFNIPNSGQVAVPNRTTTASVLTNNAGVATFSYQAALTPGDETVNALVRFIPTNVSSSIVEHIGVA